MISLSKLKDAKSIIDKIEKAHAIMIEIQSKTGEEMRVKTNEGHMAIGACISDKMRKVGIAELTQYIEDAESHLKKVIK